MSNINSKEVIQIGFFKNNQQIQVVTMSETIEKVPKQLPPEITSLREMFIEAKSFNQDISTWNTSHVTDMAYMFYGASVFNKNISSWNTSNVTDISYMFTRASAFNNDLSKWNTLNVKNMHAIFCNATTFNKNISKWNTKNVTNFAIGSQIDNCNKLPKFKN